MSNNPVFWKQANGKLISIDDMDINHLRNVLKMIIRNYNKAQTDATEKKAYWKKQNEKMFLNGDMANEFHNSFPEDEYDELCDATEIDIY